MKECKGRAITSSTGALIVFKGPDKSPHEHPPNQEEVEAHRVTTNLKLIAEEHPEIFPARILRQELASVSTGVLIQLPDRENLKKCMRRKRRQNLPQNPVSLDDLDDYPNRYAVTFSGEKFLIFDSNDSDT